tara:strand:- start:226 stop:480 length:255 start_codon:yes stop_codon:yes gene_type:complete
MAKLNDEQLKEIQGLQQQFMNFKISIADAELNKAKAVSEIQKLQVQFSEVEKKLMEEFGKDATVDLKTGEVTLPKPEEKNGENK